MMSSSVRTGSLEALLALTYVTVMWSGQRSPEELHQPLATIPMQIGDWAGREGDRRPHAAETEKADARHCVLAIGTSGARSTRAMSFSPGKQARTSGSCPGIR